MEYSSTLTSTEEQSTTKHERKSLNFVVPWLREEQFVKNPFSKSFKAKKIGDMQLGKILCREVNTMLPRIVNQQRAVAVLEKIKQVLILDTEPHEEESELRIAEIKNNKPLPDERVPKYKFAWTEEVKQYFQELENIEMPMVERIKSKQIELSTPRTKKLSDKVLFLDLDDTLIHTMNNRKKYSVEDIKATKTIHYVDQTTFKMYSLKVSLRPYALKFLEEISKYYEIVVIV